MIAWHRGHFARQGAQSMLELRAKCQRETGESGGGCGSHLKGSQAPKTNQPKAQGKCSSCMYMHLDAGLFRLDMISLVLSLARHKALWLSRSARLPRLRACLVFPIGAAGHGHRDFRLRKVLPLQPSSQLRAKGL